MKTNYRTNWRLFRTVTALIFFCCLTLQLQAQVPEGFVYPKDTVFLKKVSGGTSEPFFFSGTNNYFLMYKPMSMVNDILDGMIDLNQKVVRMWFFMDGAKFHDGYNLQPNSYEYNETGFQHIDSIMAALADRDLKCIPVFVNYWSDFGGMNQYAQWAGGTANDFYTDPTMKDIYKNYVSQWIGRVNTVNGLAYKDDPTIFSWQLTNEARSTTATLVDYVNWADEMSTHIRSLDANHMISMGDEGLMAYTYDQVTTINEERTIAGLPLISNDWPYAGGQGDWIGLLNLPNISFGTIHNYATDNWSFGLEWGKVWTSYHIEVAHSLNKPCIMEEYDKAYSGNWTRAKDQERSEVMQAYADIIHDENMAGDCSWMLVGLNYAPQEPPESGYTLNEVDANGNPTPVENLWLYRVKWPGDGHQYSKYDPFTAPVLTSHGDRMFKKNIQDAPQSFELTLPANQTTDVDIITQFEWNMAQFATNYTLVISENADLSSPVQTIENVTAHSLSLGINNTLDYNKTYFWGVTAFNYIGQQVASNNGFSFTTQAPPPPVGAFAQLSPIGSNVSNVQTIFTWESASNASYYEITVSTNGDLSAPVIENVKVNETTYAVSINLDLATDYYWRIVAFNSLHNQTASNAGLQFSTQLPDPEIDNFESYVDNAALTARWIVNSSGSPMPISLATNNVGQGVQSLKVDYNFSSYAGIQKSGANLNWKGYNGISLWLLPDGSGRDLTLQFQESSGEYWESTIQLAGSAPVEQFIPFSSFNNPSWGGVVNGTIEKEQISQFSIYLGGNGGNGTIYLDNIRASNGSVSLQAPLAVAGNNQSVIDNDRDGQEQVTLNGSGSFDSDGTIETYVWMENDQVIANGAQVTISALVGSHTYKLVVTDDSGLSDDDVVTVTVSAPENQLPIANAGQDQTVLDADGNGSELVSLDGSQSTDSDGTIVSYAWFNQNTQVATGMNASITLPLGVHTVTLRVTDDQGAFTTNTVTITVQEVTLPTTNIALNKTAFVSSTDGFAGDGAAAVDGNTGTRWASQWSDPQWIYIDLNGQHNINGVKLIWETAYGRNYEIQTSNDASTWQTIYSTQNGDGNTDDITLSGTGSYIRLYGTQRATQWGYSLWEFEVYGTAIIVDLPPVADAGSNQTVVDMNNDGSEMITLNGTGSVDPDGSIIAYRWFEAGNLLASGESQVLSFNEGTHTVILEVEDNDGYKSQDTVIIAIQPNNLFVYEAENAELSVVDTQSDFTASNSAYARMTSNGNIKWTVYAPNAGPYSVKLGYQLPYGNKTQRLNVNGQFVTDIAFSGNTNQWLETATTVDLISGYNTITVNAYWGWMDFDYLTITPASAARVENSALIASVEERFKIYPNPVDNQLNIDINADDIGQFVFNLVDLQGKLAFKKVVSVLKGDNSVTIDLSGVSSGTYIYQIVDGPNTTGGKVIVRH